MAVYQIFSTDIILSWILIAHTVEQDFSIHYEL